MPRWYEELRNRKFLDFSTSGWLPCFSVDASVKVAPYPFPYLRASSSFLCAPFHEVNQQSFVQFATWEKYAKKHVVAWWGVVQDIWKCIWQDEKESVNDIKVEMLTWHPRLSVRNLRSLFLRRKNKQAMQRCRKLNRSTNQKSYIVPFASFHLTQENPKRRSPTSNLVFFLYIIFQK